MAIWERYCVVTATLYWLQRILVQLDHFYPDQNSSDSLLLGQQRIITQFSPHCYISKQSSSWRSLTMAQSSVQHNFTQPRPIFSHPEPSFLEKLVWSYQFSWNFGPHDQHFRWTKIFGLAWLTRPGLCVQQL